MAPLFDLPEELLLHIEQLAAPKDLLALRQTCKPLARISEDILPQRRTIFFVTPSPKSFSNFLKICANDVFNQHIEEVIFVGDVQLGQQYAFTVHDLHHLDRDNIFRAREGYKNCFVSARNWDADPMLSSNRGWRLNDARRWEARALRDGLPLLRNLEKLTFASRWSEVAHLDGWNKSSSRKDLDLAVLNGTNPRTDHVVMQGGVERFVGRPVKRHDSIALAAVLEMASFLNQDCKRDVDVAIHGVPMKQWISRRDLRQWDSLVTQKTMDNTFKSLQILTSLEISFIREPNEDHQGPNYIPANGMGVALSRAKALRRLSITCEADTHSHIKFINKILATSWPKLEDFSLSARYNRLANRDHEASYPADLPRCAHLTGFVERHENSLRSLHLRNIVPHSPWDRDPVSWWAASQLILLQQSLENVQMRDLSVVMDYHVPYIWGFSVPKFAVESWFRRFSKYIILDEEVFGVRIKPSPREVGHVYASYEFAPWLMKTVPNVLMEEDIFHDGNGFEIGDALGDLFNEDCGCGNDICFQFAKMVM